MLYTNKSISRGDAFVVVVGVKVHLLGHNNKRSDTIDWLDCKIEFVFIGCDGFVEYFER